MKKSGNSLCMSIRKLTQTEKANLKSRHEGERDGRIRDRIKAVLLYDDDYSYDEIAKILLLSDEAVRKHLKHYYKINKQLLKVEAVIAN